jgi:type IV secretion system protein TrbG
MRTSRLTLVLCLVALAGCQPVVPPEPPVAPPAEDLSHWSVPLLVQPAPQKAPVPAARPGTDTEKVYTYEPGQVYKVTVALDAPLDVILEAGEKIQTVLDSDPKPIIQGPPASENGTPKPEVKARWEYREAIDGVGESARPHLLIRALEAEATAGVTLTTTRRVYYLTCKSVKTAAVRGVRWTYGHDPTAAPEDTRPRLLPHPDEPRLYHVGYQVHTSTPAPTWRPRQIFDDGKKFYLIYPELVLFGTVPLVRLIGPNGPQVVNSHQFLNVVMVDLGDVPRMELRVGTGDNAELVTITRGVLRTIACPNDTECPRWPVAAHYLRGNTP